MINAIARTNRGLVEYALHGAGGPVVLSVHAGLGGADQGMLLANFLHDGGYRILSPSRPGYLGTPLSSGRGVVEQADLLAALLDELGIDRVGVFAVSAGGPVAYTFAARHPARVWALLSVGGVSLPDPAAAPSSAFRTVFMNTVGQHLARLTPAVSARTIIARTLDETSTFTATRKRERSDYIMRTPAARQLFEAMFATTFPYQKRMPGTDNDLLQTRTLDLAFDRITAPTLVLHGSQDGDVPIEHSENAATRIRDARHRWMTGEDHLGFWLSPRSSELQRLAKEFLDQHRPRCAACG